MSTPALLAETDQKMIQNLTEVVNFKYIIKTVGGRCAGDWVVNSVLLLGSTWFIAVCAL